MRLAQLTLFFSVVNCRCVLASCASSSSIFSRDALSAALPVCSMTAAALAVLPPPPPIAAVVGEPLLALPFAAAPPLADDLSAAVGEPLVGLCSPGFVGEDFAVAVCAACATEGSDLSAPAAVCLGPAPSGSLRSDSGSGGCFLEAAGLRL